MALTKYCEYDEVRAALGVNDEELADAVLSLPVYEIGLVRELSKISSSLPAAFSTCHDAAEPDPGQKALLDAVRMFSAYAVAKQAGVSLATFALRDVGDGKATLSRFAGQPYADTMARVEATLADARKALVDAFEVYNGGAASSAITVATHFMASTRASDPVTGS